ncbi:MAG: prepilin-type N-terminal cleavage/methylation domain-containing protein [Acidobacteriia bacterium]|nr:prepilin-type N-terminal cleavage/methylation domain-containing protein [Terriglobia bacterium]
MQQKASGSPEHSARKVEPDLWIEGASLTPGFTLLEMMLVVAIILLLCSIAVPHYQRTLTFAHEAQLRDDLFTMRSIIDRFTLDNKRPPESLNELVGKGYLGAIPIDPFTGSDQTWQVEMEESAASPEVSVRGVVDVHSGSDQLPLAGAPYSNC